MKAARFTLAAAEIINGFYRRRLSYPRSASSTKNGWQLVPYTTDMAHEKVDAKLLGFKINDAQTNKTGDTETFCPDRPVGNCRERQAAHQL